MSDGVTEDFNRVFELNVVAACVCTREAVRIMRQQEGDLGHVFIVNR